MYIQWCVKGIASRPGFDWAAAQSTVSAQHGIISNWWHHHGQITPADVAGELNLANLYRHLNDYAAYGPVSPFISLAAGSVERDAYLQTNTVHSAIDTGLWFATAYGTRPGALFYCWTPVGLNPAVEVASVSESVRDLDVYRDYLPFQPEGEITAKVSLPSNQIQRVEWWDSFAAAGPVHTFVNPSFVEPTPLTTLRELF
jgi:hypothetical protein